MKVAQWYWMLCDPMDYTVHGILQARILEWIAVSHMATHSSILAWRTPRTEESSGLQSMWSKRLGHYWNDLRRTHVLYPDKFLSQITSQNFLFRIYSHWHTEVRWWKRNPFFYSCSFPWWLCMCYVWSFVSGTGEGEGRQWQTCYKMWFLPSGHSKSSRGC